MARLALATGDPSGIGPEVSLKAVRNLLRTEQHSRHSFLLLGDSQLLHRLNTELKLDLPLQDSSEFSAKQDAEGSVQILDEHKFGFSAPPAPFSAVSAKAALTWLRQGAELCLNGSADAVITAPVCKESIVDLGEKFVGQTELLAELCGCSEFAMMLLGRDEIGRWLRVGLVTTHLPIAQVPAAIQPEKIKVITRLCGEAALLLGIEKPRVGVCGLNPHAGEGGKIGREEIEVIIPAIRAFSDERFEVSGPHAADSLFAQAYRGRFDVVVAMYHDQGLAPLKLAAFERGINWTLGLPIIRTSPDHGTAFNIVGKGVADSRSMEAAIELATQLVQKKSQYWKSPG